MHDDLATGRAREELAKQQLGHHAGRVQVRRAELERLLAGAPRRLRRRAAVTGMTPEALARQAFKVG